MSVPVLAGSVCACVCVCVVELTFTIPSVLPRHADQS